MALQDKTTPPLKVTGKSKKTLLILLKVLVSSALLYLVASNTGIGKVAATLKEINILYFLIAAFIYVFSIYISAVRLRLLLPESYKTGHIFSISLIGSFFNNFLPGIVGGDAVKAYYLHIDLKDKANIPRHSMAGSQHSGLVTAIASVFMDRYIGFAALMFVGIAAFPFGFRYFNNSYIKWLLPLIVMLFIAGSFLVFGLRLGRSISLLSGVYDYFSLYARQKAVITKAFLISIIVQASGIFAVYILGIGLKIYIPLLPLFIFIPIISSITTIPISMSGIGLREASFVLLLGFLKLTPVQATAISFSWFLSTAVGSLTGLIEYIRYKKRQVTDYCL